MDRTRTIMSWVLLSIMDMPLNNHALSADRIADGPLKTPASYRKLGLPRMPQWSVECEECGMTCTGLSSNASESRTGNKAVARYSVACFNFATARYLRETLRWMEPFHRSSTRSGKAAGLPEDMTTMMNRGFSEIMQGLLTSRLRMHGPDSPGSNILYLKVLFFLLRRRAKVCGRNGT